MKTSFFIGCFILIFSPLQAQNWELGVKGGLNIAKVRVVNDDDRSSKLGANLGGFIRTDLSDNMDIQGEVQLSFQGWDGVNVTYINIPVVVKYYVAEQFDVFAGPQLGLLVSAEGNREPLLNETDIGINFGAEYHINEIIGVGANFNTGLSNVLIDDEGNRKFRNRVFQVFVAYRLSPK
ncbi:MAG: PorT family protein [Cyclobacteriaceae bacterium]|nr:PorT family protein [Cyclobacteriaceae bacterium]